MDEQNEQVEPGLESSSLSKSLAQKRDIVLAGYIIDAAKTLSSMIEESESRVAIAKLALERTQGEIDSAAALPQNGWFNRANRKKYEEALNRPTELTNRIAKYSQIAARAKGAIEDLDVKQFRSTVNLFTDCIEGLDYDSETFLEIRKDSYQLLIDQMTTLWDQVEVHKRKIEPEESE